MASREIRGGFTLIELLIVVAIIAILAMIAIPNFLEAQTRAKVAREKSDLRTIDVALESYMVDNSVYPPWTERPGAGDVMRGWIHPDSWRFAWLTTPIAYLTTVLWDPYALNKQWDETDHGLPRWDTYDLVTYQTQGDLRWTYAHAWRINGFGPDYVNQFAGGRSDWKGGTVDNSFYNFPNYMYDPTNGTVSWGDVIRVGNRVETHERYDPIELYQ